LDDASLRSESTNAPGRRSENLHAAANPARELLEAAAFVALFVGLEWLSFLHEQDGYSVTPWNPGLGIAFAMIIYRGPLYGLLLFLGVLLIEVFVVHSTPPWPILISIGITVAASYSLAAIAARRWLRLDSPLEGASEVIVIVIAGVLGAAVDAVTLSALLYAVSGYEQLLQSMLPLFVGDVIGIAVFSPLALRLMRYRSQPPAAPRLREVGEAMAYLAVTALALVIALYPAEGWPRDMFYLLFLPIGVASIRFGVDGACASLAAAQLGLITILHFHGFDVGRFTEYQVMMFVLTLTGLIVGGLSSERQAAEAGRRRAARRIAELQAEATRVARFNIMSGMSAALAHEINQPFTAARALARAIEELLRRPGADTDRAAANAASLVTHIDTAGAIINRMRAFLRRGEPHISTVELEKLIEDSIALVRPLALSRQIQLTVQVPSPAPLVYADPIQVQQVLMNLVLNAIESIAESGAPDARVGLRVNCTATEVEIAVLDNGIGIPRERTENLFEPLNTTRPGGMGLGLSISKSIVEAHGGRIWLHSGAPGLTEFRFTLPLESHRRA
jgi:signal transduction histidine kinase